MKITESECVSCGFPCNGNSCPFYRVTRLYCDNCEEETDLYYFDTKDGTKELCLECILFHIEQNPENYFEKVRKETEE